jgi:hypothetical protein
MAHIERKTELRRKQHRREKVRKLRAKLAKAKNPHEAQLIINKIRAVSPFWVPQGGALKDIPAGVQLPSAPAKSAPAPRRK